MQHVCISLLMLAVICVLLCEHILVELFSFVMLRMNHIHASLSSSSSSGNFLFEVYVCAPFLEQNLISMCWILNVFNATNSYLKVNFDCIGVGVEKLVTQPISERTISAGLGEKSA